MPATDIDHSLHNISTVAGRYVLGQQAMRPGVNIFACRLRSISPTGFAVAAPVIGQLCSLRCPAGPRIAPPC